MQPYNVLFLCTGNSARSILAESILRHRGGDRFIAYSAGSQPKGSVNPFAITLLKELSLPIDGLRSKSWDEFATPGAPAMDFVFTVCGSAAGEVCPVWPGHPVTTHWGVDDSAAVEGSDQTKLAAFRKAYRELEARIESFVSLPVASLDRATLQQRVVRIGQMNDAPG